jgi:hypothetical protein
VISYNCTQKILYHRNIGSSRGVLRQTEFCRIPALRVVLHDMKHVIPAVLLSLLEIVALHATDAKQSVRAELANQDSSIPLGR